MLFTSLLFHGGLNFPDESRCPGAPAVLGKERAADFIEMVGDITNRGIAYFRGLLEEVYRFGSEVKQPMRVARDSLFDNDARFHG